MTFVDHLKGIKGENLVLEAAFGYHVIAGDLTKSIVTGTDPTHVVTVQQMLGDAYGKGWQGPKGVWFRGTNRAASKYKFHPGIQTPNPVLVTFTVDSSTDTINSTAHPFADGDMIIHKPGDLPLELIAGVIYYVRDSAANSYKVAATSGGTAINLSADGSGLLQVYENHPDQGIDPIFHQDVPHSNTAWLRLECPNGSEVGIPAFDTKNDPPIGHSGIYGCQLGDIYDGTGTIVDTDILLVNPADVLSFGCKEIREYPNTRLDWPSLEALRNFSDDLITPDYTILPVGVGLTGKYYDGAAFGTLKSTRHDPVIQYDLSNGAPALDISPTGFSVLFEGKIRFKNTETVTITVIHNDSVKLWLGVLTGTPDIDEAAAGTHSTTYAATADEFVDIKIEWTNASGDSQFWLQWSSPSISLQVIPQDRLYPKNEPIPRFRSHVAFTQRTSFEDFLKSVLFTCNGVFQDVDGKLKFFSIDQIASSYDFDQTNIVKNTFRSYPRFTQQELMSLPNRFIAEGRDLDSRYLEKFDPQLYYDVPELQELAGRIIEETVQVGNMNRWQALLNLRHYAKLRTSPRMCEFVGMPQTLGVLPGDRVRVSQSLQGWVNKGFLVFEATDLSIDRDADHRFFRLVSWSEELTDEFSNLLFDEAGEVLEED